MAKVCSVNRNNKRVALAKKYKAKREALKAIIHNPSATEEEIFAAQLKLQKLPRNSAPARIRNRCALTGRSRGYYRKPGLSRIQLRKLANEAQIPGMTKSSW